MDEVLLVTRRQPRHRGGHRPARGAQGLCRRRQLRQAGPADRPGERRRHRGPRPARRRLAKEVANEGIRVNAVRPGLIETEIHASGGLPNRVRDLQHLVPMQRGGSAEEVAQAIVWLLSPEASYTTMSLVDVSGGR